jgi:ankyrin repeat protein
MLKRRVAYLDDTVVLNATVPGPFFRPALKEALKAINQKRDYDLYRYHLSQDEVILIQETYEFALSIHATRVVPVNEHYLLQESCKDNNALVSVSLVWAGADINSFDKDHNTPLEIAVEAGNKHLVAFLLKNNANPNIANKDLITPLEVASFLGDTNIIKMLLDNGANPNCVDRFWNTPLLIALEQNNPAAVKMLLLGGADPNLAPLNGFSPLMAAVVNKIIESVLDLLAAGADINSCDDLGHTALQFALAQRDTLIAQLLISENAAFPVSDIYRRKFTGFMLTFPQDNRKIVG